MLRDSAFIYRVSPLLQRFTSNGGDRYSFRCPYCGDSKKDPLKARGNLKPAPFDSTKLIYKCFNCDIQRSFRSLVRDLDESIYRDYLVESVRQGGASGELPDNFWDTSPKKGSPDPHRRYTLPEDVFQNLLSLSPMDPARRYVSSRKIPLHQQSRIWFTDQFRRVSNECDPEKFNKPGQIFPESRVVFPCMTPCGSRMTAFQGRSLDPDAKVRYIMIMVDKSGGRIFGLDKVDPNFTAIVMEGPIDTLFVDNSVALCGATATVEVPLQKKVFFLDQEPRNPHIVERLHQLVDSGEKVVLLPEEYHEKDANELHIETGISSADLRELALSHSYSGLSAKLQLTRWAVVDRASTNPRKGKKHDEQRISY